MSKSRRLSSEKKAKANKSAANPLGFFQKILSYFAPAKVQVGEVIPDEPVSPEKSSRSVSKVEEEQAARNHLASALNKIVEGCGQADWMYVDDEEKAGSFILKVRRNHGVGPKNSAAVIAEVLEANSIPVTQTNTVLSVPAQIKIDGISVVKKINEAIYNRFIELRQEKVQRISKTNSGKLEVEELDSEESQSQSISSIDSSTTPVSQRAKPLSSRQRMAFSDSDISSSAALPARQRKTSEETSSSSSTPPAKQRKSS